MNLSSNQFTIVKNDYKTKEGQPDYKMKVKFGDSKWVEVAGIWLKDGTDKDGKPRKYFSGKMNEAYGERAGYLITTQAPDPLSVQEVRDLAKADEINPEDIKWS